MNQSTGMRLSALAIVALSLIGALTARLWFLTAVEGEAAVEAATANRIRTLHIQAPRGRVFDRERRILVDNTQVRQLRVDTRVSMRPSSTTGRPGSGSTPAWPRS